EFGKIEENKDPALFEKNLLSIKPNDLVTICYTSGTTGIPKGAMLTHQNFQAMLDNCVKIFSKYLKPEAETDLLYLPFSHIIGRAEAFATHVFGWKGCFAENLEALPQALVEIRPTVLFSVPRIFEKSWRKISDRIEHSTKLQKKIFYSALESGKKYLHNQASLTEKMNYLFCKRVFFQKIIKNFGGNLKVVLCGGAPLSAEIANVFQVLGLTILEGYGLTETCGPVTLNSLEKNKIGTVGKPLHDVSLKTTQDGEILVQSKSVFNGYYKMPTETTETLKEGWFYTGDIGFIDNDGFLHVTDRKKDIIVTSGGKNIAPQKIENLLKAKTFICHFIVHGDNRNYLTALVTLNRDIITKYAIDNKILFSDYTELIKNPKIHTAIQKEVDEVNAVLASFERIKKFTLLPRDFSIANGELTPSLKIKRRAIEKRYKAELDRMYETLDSTIK
ncbi:MAG: long-chain fatty acid--CoA ligase, partial [Deltaproteobacteria bacterium]|nr:long-chain fatty acid--CoA ligase [Deltaproteobacteria bacterium]